MQLYILENTKANWDSIESIAVYAESEEQARAIVMDKVRAAEKYKPLDVPDDLWKFRAEPLTWDDPDVVTCELFDLTDKTPRVAHVHIIYG